MARFGRRSLKLGIILFIAACFGMSLVPSRIVSALSGSDFQAGHIIDDYVFTNASSMSVQDIQNFLNSKVTTCSTNHTGYTGGTGTTYNPPFVCLKDFYENPSASYTVGFSYTDVNGNPQTGSRTYYNNNAYKVTALCPVYGGYTGTPTCGSGDYHNGLDHLIPTLQTTGLGIPSGGQSAAQIIYNAAQQYSINPQVLIVLLQKEQGLVTDDWPAFYEYQTATGYGCPDTAPCSSNYAGFSNQVISAAWQFRRYMDNPNGYNYVVGNNYIQYNPVASCGGSTVNIQNQATAALYDYTPYQPNAAALSVVSDSSAGGSVPCGAYGNRNFWWYFTKWFGTTYTANYSWQLTSQYAFTDDTKNTAIGLNSLLPGQRAYIGFTALNTGNVTWTNSGPNAVDVGTLRPTARNSPFYDPTWLGYSRPATMKEASVAPGQTATFEFWITAPTSSTGNYKEYFGLVAEGRAWMPDIGMYYGISVQPARYTWALTSQYAFTDDTKNTATGLGNMQPGQKLYVGFTALNTGNVTWTNSGPNAVDVGTLRPTDRASPFYDSTWLGYGRPARMKEASVAPGQTATFEFWIKAPTNAFGNFHEYFDLVAEGKAWMQDIGFNYAISIITPHYSWQLTSQYAFADATKTTAIGLNNLSPSQIAYVGFTAKNTGNTTWQNSGSNPMDVGTSNPSDRISQFCSPGLGWLGCNRPARMKEASVAPGQTATFEFPIEAPATPGAYREYFDPVIEGVTWLPSIGFNYYITVR